MLTRGITQRIELPHEPGQWVEVRALSGLQLDTSRDARLLKAVHLAREMGPALQAPLADQETRAAVIEAARDPLNDYDRRALLHAGIIAWSYDAPVTLDNIDDLDDETMTVVARALLPPQRTEADRKNGSAQPTSSSRAMTPKPS